MKHRRNDRTKARTFTEYGGHGVKIALTEVRDTEQVYWSPQHNSYVVAADGDGMWMLDGTPCNLLSINGMGEIRWAVTSEQGSTNGDTDAAKYFGLVWLGYRGNG